MLCSLNSIIIEASDFLSSEFNLILKESRLKMYTPTEWEQFFELNKNSIVGLKKEHEGLYVPKTYSAYARLDSPVVISNTFHEFFGHGLFCEHSQIGKTLVDIVQSGGDSESFLYKEVNPSLQPLGLTHYNIHNYEGFALWLEALLCKETSNSKIWELKKEKLHPEYVNLFEFFNQAEKKLTTFGFMSQMGFPKHYDQEKLISSLKCFYDGHFSDVNFIVLYGSRKPESDIDLFIVSNGKSQNLFNGWLDIFELNKEEFQDLVDKLDISVTDPLFSGQIIYGDTNYFETLKKRVIDVKINEGQVNHNLSKAKKGGDYLLTRSNTPREEKIFRSYLKSYTIAAEELKKGNKILTLEKVKRLHPNQT